MEQQLSEGEEVVIVGGGNSAGQAAVFLSRTVEHAHILVRGAGLAATMSDYLVRRIESSPKITLHPFTEITALAGDAILREVTWTHRKTGASETRRIGNVFVMIGAEPNTDWLDGCLALDPQRIHHHRPRCRRKRAGFRVCDDGSRASSQSETCGPAQSSASRLALEKARWSCRQCTAFLIPASASSAATTTLRRTNRSPPVPPGQMS